MQHHGEDVAVGLGPDAHEASAQRQIRRQVEGQGRRGCQGRGHVDGPVHLDAVDVEQIGDLGRVPDDLHGSALAVGGSAEHRTQRFVARHHVPQRRPCRVGVERSGDL